MPVLHRRPTTLVLIATLAWFSPAGAEPCALRWRQLQPGLEYATASVHCGGRIDALDRITVKDTRLHLVRAAPGKARLRALMASALDRKTRTAAQWASDRRLAVVINLGMYHGDHSTHVGYLRSAKHVNSKRWIEGYQSILALGPGTAAMIDRDTKGPRRLDGYHTVVQNLRLIRRGKDGASGVWSKQTRRWSEAAVGQDDRGRLLFLFNRAPLTMWELNRLLLKLPLGIVRAMHMEGGPEASLSIRTKAVRLDLCGSFETGYVSDDSNTEQWPLPNVLGVPRP